VPGTGGTGGDGGDGLGGAIFNLGEATLVNVSLLDNGAEGGRGGTGGFGGACLGGFFAGRIGSSGTGGVGGGGGYFNQGTLMLDGSVAYQNEARAGHGGNGLPRAGDTAWRAVATLGGRGGEAQGGAGRNLGSNLIVNSTFTLNRTLGGASGLSGWDNGFICPGAAGPLGGAVGGAVFNLGTLALVNSTLWENSVQGALPTNYVITNFDKCIVSVGLPGFSLGDTLVNSNLLTLVNTIVGGPSSTSNCVGQLTDQGHNLSSDDSAAFSAPGSLNRTDPKLSALGDHGGPTLTLALLWGSPAIDAGSDADCPLTDQRGRTRPALAHCDIGAFELIPDQLRIVTLFPRQPVHLEGVGPALQAFDIEAAADLKDFQKAASGVVDGSCRFEVEVPGDGRWRFFRARAR
jgi:hypothetical protein